MECIKIWLSLRLQLRWSHSLCQYSLTLFCRYQVQLSSQVSNAHEWEILFSDWWSHKRSIVQRRMQSHGLDVWKISISSTAKYYLLAVPNWKEFCMTLKTKARIKFQVDHTATVNRGNVSIVDRRESLYHLECQFIKKCCCLSMLCTSLRDWSLSTIGCSSASLGKSASLASSEVVKYSNLSLIMVWSWAALQVFLIRRVMPIVRTEQKFSTNPTHRRLFYPIEGLSWTHS